MENFFATTAPNWYREAGATSQQLEDLKRQCKFSLPPDYLSFLVWSNGGEGKIGNNYFSLWSCEKVTKRNINANINSYLPDVLGIATDGGDYCYALDYKSSDAEPSLILVPLGDLDRESFVTIGSSFAEGLRNLLTKDF